MADDKGAMVTDVELAVSIKIEWSGPSHGLHHFKTAMNPNPNAINCNNVLTSVRRTIVTMLSCDSAHADRIFGCRMNFLSAQSLSGLDFR